MASAVAHVYSIAYTFYIDIKLANFVLNFRKDLVLIDQEQSRVAPYTLAPEADGSQDVKEARIGSIYYRGVDLVEQKLVYEKYYSLYRENLAQGRPKQNIFLLQRNINPRALEAVEVFSLSRTIQMLLEQVIQSEVEDLSKVVISQSDIVKDVPEDQKGIISRYLNPNPNERISLLELVDFQVIVQRKGRACPPYALILLLV